MLGVWLRLQEVCREQRAPSSVSASGGTDETDEGEEDGWSKW